MITEEFITIPEERMKLLKADPRIVKKIQDLTGVKIGLNEDVSIDCEDSILRNRVKEFFKAFGRGFTSETALNLLDEEYILEIIEISKYSGKSQDRQKVLKARVIGKEGKAKKKIEKDCDVKISVYGKTVWIIGKWEKINLARESVENLLRGSRHTSVYRFLEERKIS